MKVSWIKNFQVALLFQETYAVQLLQVMMYLLFFTENLDRIRYTEPTNRNFTIIQQKDEEGFITDIVLEKKEGSDFSFAQLLPEGYHYFNSPPNPKTSFLRN